MKRILVIVLCLIVLWFGYSLFTYVRAGLYCNDMVQAGEVVVDMDKCISWYAPRL